MREPDSRFLFYLCEMFGKMPSDPFFEEMNPVEKRWLYEGWVQKIEREIEVQRNIGILIGGFSNPEMARKMVKLDNPDHSSTDEEFEDSWKMVEESAEKSKKNKRKSRRRQRKEQKIND